jgi:hypothetical protein
MFSDLTFPQEGGFALYVSATGMACVKAARLTQQLSEKQEGASAQNWAKRLAKFFPVPGKGLACDV